MMPVFLRSGCFLRAALFLLLAIGFLGRGAPLCAGQPVNRNSKEDEIKKIETDLKKEREQLLNFHEKEKVLLKELSRLEREIEEKKQFLTVLRQKINASKTESEKLKDGLRELDMAQKDVQTRLNMRLVAFYKNAKRGYLHLLNHSSGLDQLQKWIKYFNVIVAEDQTLIKRMNRLQVKKIQDLNSLKDKMSAVDHLEQSESERLLSLKQDNEAKIMLLMKIHKEKDFYATAVSELELASQKLKETIVRLDQRDLRVSLTTRFGDAKGKLAPPMEGRVVEIKKEAADNFSKVYRGIYIEGTSAAEVRAVFDGKIEYSGLLKGYGQIIVINHGTRFFTVSAHLSRRVKEKGDTVKRGEVIGFLEKAETTSRPRLYFEIRQGGINLSPIEWLKLN